MNSSPGTLISANRGPAEPSVALVAVQVSGLNAAWIWMVTEDVRIEPQMLAACWKQSRRCWPIVVPELPPTGAAGVGSLKPSPAPSVLMMTIVAEAKAEVASTASRAVAASAVRRRTMVTCPPTPCPGPAASPAWARA